MIYLYDYDTDELLNEQQLIDSLPDSDFDNLEELIECATDMGGSCIELKPEYSGLSVDELFQRYKNSRNDECVFFTGYLKQFEEER